MQSAECLMLPCPTAALHCSLLVWCPCSGAECYQYDVHFAFLLPRMYAPSLQSQRRSGGGSNVHDWTFFVRMDSPEDEQRFIERVVVHLHPTFRCGGVGAGNAAQCLDTWGRRGPRAPPAS